MCSCCTAAGCHNTSFISGDGASCTQAECETQFFKCPDPTSTKLGDSNKATPLNITSCVYPPPPPPCGSDDCTCSCCSGDGCPAKTIPELPTHLFRAGLAAASQHGQRAFARRSPCCHRPLQKPTRLLRAALLGPRGTPLPLGCRREAAALRTGARPASPISPPLVIQDCTADACISRFEACPAKDTPDSQVKAAHTAVAECPSPPHPLPPPPPTPLTSPAPPSQSPMPAFPLSAKEVIPLWAQVVLVGSVGLLLLCAIFIWYIRQHARSKGAACSVAPRPRLPNDGRCAHPSPQSASRVRVALPPRL